MNTPIFDQLVTEFAARGKRYENMTKSYTRKPQGLRGVTPTVSQIDEVQQADTGSEDETMSFAVVKPIAVLRLGQRGATA